jgi:hypothetical protein
LRTDVHPQCGQGLVSFAFGRAIDSSQRKR